MLPSGGQGQPPVFDDGPPVLVAIIGEASGRWADANAVLRAAFERAGARVAGPPPTMEGPAILGFAVVKAWHFVVSLEDQITKAMFEACFQSEGGQRDVAVSGALSHPVLTACALVEPMQAPWFAASAPLGEQARQAAGNVPMNVFNHTGSCVCATYSSLDGVLARWVASGVVQQEDLLQCFAWPLWAPLAIAVVEKKWKLDLTAVVQRTTQWQRWKPPVQPPDSLVRQYKQWLKRSGGIPALSPATGKCKYEPQQQVSCLGVSQYVTSQRNVRAAASAAAATMALSGAPGALSDSAGGHGSASSAVPQSWSTIWRSRARLDVCAMLVQRQSGAARDFRYLFFDASPQRSGREVFCCAERLIPCSAVTTIASASVVDRRLPICGLGQGRTSLPDKVACLVHQLWLEYGPSAAGVRCACRSVRCCLSDMGVEFGICDFPDVVDDLMAQHLVGIHVDRGSLGCGNAARASASASSAGVASHSAPVSSTATGAFLFPLALKVPGIRHIVDWVLQRAVERCPWWPQWQAQCKQIVQCLHSARQRERLQQWLHDQEAVADRGALAALLANSPPNFATWRWFTLARVIAFYVRAEPALQLAACAAQRGAPLFESRLGAAADISATLASAAFGDRARGLRDLMEPLVRFTQWLGRCLCHSESDAGAAACPWKGCVGPQLATLVQKTVAELSDLRQARMASAASAGASDSSCSSDIAASAELAMADLLTKFHWVQEPPYLVWQASLAPRLRARCVVPTEVCLEKGGWGVVAWGS